MEHDAQIMAEKMEQNERTRKEVRGNNWSGQYTGKINLLFFPPSFWSNTKENMKSNGQSGGLVIRQICI